MSEWYQIVDKARSLIDEIDAKLNHEQKQTQEPERKKPKFETHEFGTILTNEVREPECEHEFLPTEKGNWECEECAKCGKVVNVRSGKPAKKELRDYGVSHEYEPLDMPKKDELAERLHKEYSKDLSEKDLWEVMADEARKYFKEKYGVEDGK